MSIRVNKSSAHPRHQNIKLGLFIGAICLVLFSPQLIFGQPPGISKTEIILGQSCDLKGPRGELGKAMRDGALAYFDHINSVGGIHGKEIRLITYNDGDERKASIANTRKLIHQDNVFLLFGFVGTAPSKVAVPIATRNEVPFFAPSTGSEALRNPFKPYVFNLRASYYQETRAMVMRLMRDKGIERISVFYEDNSYGKAGLERVRKVLAEKDLKVVNKTAYSSQSGNVEPAVRDMLLTRPGAIIMIVPWEPCSRFISSMRDSGSRSIFLNYSSVNADALAWSLGNKGLGVVVTQVVPFHYHTRIPVISQFNRLTKQFLPGTEPSPMAIEGFIAAKALCKILLETPRPITRKGFIETAEKQSDVDLGGFSFSFGPNNHQGSTSVYFTQVGPGGYITPIENLNHLYKYRK